MRFWKRSEMELDREMAHHLHHLAAEYERQGYSRREALQMARREFGGAEQFKEACRDQRRWAWLTGFRQDIVFGLRMMRGAPAITLAAVLSLALGIGANAAIASLMDVILWRALPVSQPQQLRLVQWQAHGFPRDLADGGSGSMYNDQGVDVADFFSYSAFQRLRKSVQEHASVAAYNDSMPVSVTYQGRPTVADERPVSGNFFATLLTRAAMGRLLVDEDDRAAAPAVAVVSHRFWANTLASDRNVIGKTLIVNSRAHVIVGVMAPEFFGLYPGDATAIYAPIHHAASRDGWNPTEWLSKDRSWGTQVIARLAPETNAAQLREQMNAVFRSTWTRAPEALAT